jgi:hypothetical protein
MDEICWSEILEKPRNSHSGITVITKKEIKYKKKIITPILLKFFHLYTDTTKDYKFDNAKYKHTFPTTYRQHVYIYIHAKCHTLPTISDQLPSSNREHNIHT